MWNPRKINHLAGHGAHLDTVTRGALAQGQGPEAITMAVRTLPIKARRALAFRFLPHSPQIRVEFGVAHHADLYVLEIAEQRERQIRLLSRGESHRLDLPFKIGLGLLGKLHPYSGGVDAGAFELR